MGEPHWGPTSINSNFKAFQSRVDKTMEVADLRHALDSPRVGTMFVVPAGCTGLWHTIEPISAMSPPR